ncbi:uncharacterized protein BXZ73DRAFT_99520 [Epithele typhae]|uniref:uncharacterized protein n=1 Tax=Epithele typhae TaxID=378194 RepID=UPI0020081384|nr:uncharacterized protein BXZ73DRAFT_99520 [Epithele typhae]KAH9939320.1 hypothetical protein BXZ73DRAFT_99520 [Epithele typhae]
MSSTPNNHFVIRARDLPNSRRKEFLEAHMTYIGPLIARGDLVTVALLLPEGAQSSEVKDAGDVAVGVIITLRAESVDAVWEVVHNDPFYKSGEVYDRSTVTVEPVYIVLKN